MVLHVHKLVYRIDFQTNIRVDSIMNYIITVLSQLEMCSRVGRSPCRILGAQTRVYRQTHYIFIILVCRNLYCSYWKSCPTHYEKKKRFTYYNTKIMGNGAF